jgi:hypothetical protein
MVLSKFQVQTVTNQVVYRVSAETDHHIVVRVVAYGVSNVTLYAVNLEY